jgi:hypothetical protein
MARVTSMNPDKSADRLIGMRPPADREIIRHREVMAVLRENLPNQFKEPARTPPSTSWTTSTRSSRFCWMFAGDRGRWRPAGATVLVAARWRSV